MGHPAGFIRRHAADNVFFSQLVQVKPKFGFELTVHTTAEEQ
jgi:hypothetical protein